MLAATNSLPFLFPKMASFFRANRHRLRVMIDVDANGPAQERPEGAVHRVRIHHPSAVDDLAAEVRRTGRGEDEVEGGITIKGQGHGLFVQHISVLADLEVRNAIEELGGDAGEERTFYGDPHYEAMRGM